MLQGLTFNENHRIDSRSDSCNMQIWESISLIELYSKCNSFSEIWFLWTEMKVSTWCGLATHDLNILGLPHPPPPPTRPSLSHPLQSCLFSPSFFPQPRCYTIGSWLRGILQSQVTETVGSHSPHDWLRTRVHKNHRKGKRFWHKTSSTSFAKRVYFSLLITL